MWHSLVESLKTVKQLLAGLRVELISLDPGRYIGTVIVAEAGVTITLLKGPGRVFIIKHVHDAKLGTSSPIEAVGAGHEAGVNFYDHIQSIVVRES